MMKWLKTKFGMAPKPVLVNATPSERSARNIARMHRLQAMIDAGDTRPSVLEELKRRQETGR